MISTRSNQDSSEYSAANRSSNFSCSGDPPPQATSEQPSRTAAARRTNERRRMKTEYDHGGNSSLPLTQMAQARPTSLNVMVVDQALGWLIVMSVALPVILGLGYFVLGLMNETRELKAGK